MRIGLTVKLLIILGLTSAVSVLAMGLAARWSFQHGFLDYLGKQELKRFAPLREALVEAYEEHGSWDLFQRNPGVWPRFVDDALAPSHTGQSRYLRPPPDAAGGGIVPEPNQPIRPPRDPSQHDPPGHEDAPAFPPRGGLPLGLHGGQFFAPPGAPPPGPGFAPPPGGPGFGPPPPRQGGLTSGLRLLDDQSRSMAGGQRIVGEELLIPLESDGVVIGWLGRSQPPWLEDKLAQRFNSQHNRSLVWIAMGALTLAMLLGWIFSEGILRRVRAVAGGARRLSKGDYATRIAPKGRDELAALAEDFNHLAAALERNKKLRRSSMADVSHEQPFQGVIKRVISRLEQLGG